MPIGVIPIAAIAIVVAIDVAKAGRPSGTARMHGDRNAVSSPLGNGLSLVDTFQLRGAAQMPDKQRQGTSPTDSKTTSLRRQLLRAVLAPESLAILPEDDWVELIGRLGAPDDVLAIDPSGKAAFRARGNSIILCVGRTQLAASETPPPKEGFILR